MKGFRKAVAVLALGAASVGAWFGVMSLVHDVQFARASQEVELNRQELQNIQDLSSAYRKVGKVVEPSVVKIDVTKTLRGERNLQRNDDFLRRFFPDRDNDGQPDVPEEYEDRFNGERRAQGEGSGVIMQVDGSTGHILTNNHVAGGASELQVTLWDGRVIDDAKLVGVDPKSDLAVIKINADHLIAAKWGNSDTLEKGDIILAFGSPFGYVGSMTHGIVSALNRQARIIESQFSYEDFIQVDAPINPGNSGGPLANLRGEVVGINTAIATRTGGFQGIGLAIPANMAKPIFEQIREKGKVVRGWLGVTIGDMTQPIVREKAQAGGFTGEKGIYVDAVLADAPAAGQLKAGDIVTAINGKPVETVAQLRGTIAAVSPGTDVKLTLQREGKPEEVTIRVEEQPEDLLSRANRTTENGGRNRPADPDATITAAALGLKLGTPTESELLRLRLGDQQGSLVKSVAPQSIAAQHGIRAGELITRISDQPVTSAQQAGDELAKHDLKKGVLLTITSKEGERIVLVKAR